MFYEAEKKQRNQNYLFIVCHLANNLRLNQVTVVWLGKRGLALPKGIA